MKASAEGQRAGTSARLAQIGMALTVSAASLAMARPVKAYDPSPYAAVPWIWILLATSMGLAAFAILLGGKRWGLMAGILAVSCAMLLPLLRGYYHFGSADSATHVGFLNDLVRTGRVTDQNYYPATHILGGVVAITSSISTAATGMVLPAAFVALLIIGFVLLITEHNGALFPGAALVGLSVFPLNHVEVTPALQPTSFGLFFLPLTLWSVRRLKSGRPGSVAVATILIVGLATLHPIHSLTLSIVLMVLYFVAKLGPDWRVLIGRPISLLAGAGIGAIVTTMLIFVNSQLARGVAGIAESLAILTRPAGSQFTATANALDSLGVSRIEFICRIALVPIALGLLTLFLASLRSRRGISPSLLMLGGVVMAVSGGLAVAAFLGSPYAIATRYLGVFSIGLGIATAGLSKLGSGPMRRVAQMGLGLLPVIGLLAIPYSSFVLTDSEHVTQAQVEGAVFSTFKPAQHIQTMEIRRPIFRLRDIAFGPELAASLQQDQQLRYGRISSPTPYHFQFVDTKPHYIFVTSADKYLDGVLYDGFRFSMDDFTNFEKATTSLVYSNGDAELLFNRP